MKNNRSIFNAIPEITQKIKKLDSLFETQNKLFLEELKQHFKIKGVKVTECNVSHDFIFLTTIDYLMITLDIKTLKFSINISNNHTDWIKEDSAIAIMFKWIFKYTHENKTIAIDKAKELIELRNKYFTERNKLEIKYDSILVKANITNTVTIADVKAFEEVIEARRVNF